MKWENVKYKKNEWLKERPVLAVNMVIMKSLNEDNL
jgi:hypothetical protein